jgi:hypothetical protein
VCVCICILYGGNYITVLTCTCTCAYVIITYSHNIYIYIPICDYHIHKHIYIYMPISTYIGAQDALGLFYSLAAKIDSSMYKDGDMDMSGKHTQIGVPFLCKDMFTLLVRLIYMLPGKVHIGCMACFDVLFLRKYITYLYTYGHTHS